jgi:hypothetical protein
MTSERDQALRPLEHLLQLRQAHRVVRHESGAGGLLGLLLLDAAALLSLQLRCGLGSQAGGRRLRSNTAQHAERGARAEWKAEATVQA